VLDTTTFFMGIRIIMLRRLAFSGTLSLTLLFILTAVACLARVGSETAGITIHPDSGGGNTQVLITGTGFSPNTALSLRLGPPDVGATPQSYGQAITDNDGLFSLMFFMPDHWPDETPITETELVIVIINEDGSIKATAPFEFQPDRAAPPQLTIQPGNGAPGQQVTVTGQRFHPHANLGLRLGVADTRPSEINLVEVKVDTQGAFQAEMAIPLTWPGSDAPVVERELLITAVDEEKDQMLATASFFNTAGRLAPTASATPVHAP
jgi:hypothetical protein